MAPLFVGAPVRPNMLNMPKSASAYCMDINYCDDNKVKGKDATLDTAPPCERNSLPKRSCMARIVEGFHRFICTPTRLTTKKGKCIAVRELTITATGNHLPYGITQCYLPPGRGGFPAFTPAEAGTRI